MTQHANEPDPLKDLGPGLYKPLNKGAKLDAQIALVLLITIVIVATLILFFTEVGDIVFKNIGSSITTRSSSSVHRKVIVRVETPQGPRVGSSVIEVKGQRQTNLEGRTYGAILARGSGQRVLLPNGDELFVPPLSRSFTTHWRDEGKVLFSCGDVDTGGTWSPTGFVVREGIIVAQVSSCDMGWYGKEHGYSMRAFSIPTEEAAGMETYQGWSQSTEEAKMMDPLWKLDAKLAEKSVPFRKDAVRPSMGRDTSIDKNQMYKDDF